MTFPEFVVTINQRNIYGSCVTVNGANLPVESITIEQSVDKPYPVVVLRVPIIPGNMGRIEVVNEALSE